MKLPIFIVIIILLFCGAVSAEIYQHIDENGKRHFSDRPVDAAESLQFFDSQYETVAGAEATTIPAPSPTQSKTSYRPAKKTITADDYKISVQVSQMRDMVLLSGRISEGPPCSRFKIDFTLQDRDGHLIHLITVAEDIGGFLSDLLEASKRVKYGTTDNEWNIIATSGTCLK